MDYDYSIIPKACAVQPVGNYDGDQLLVQYNRKEEISNRNHVGEPVGQGQEVSYSMYTVNLL